MRTLIDQARELVRRIHEDEDGMETMQVVMIVAVAAAVVVVLYKFGDKVFQWGGQKTDEMIQSDFKNKP